MGLYLGLLGAARTSSVLVVNDDGGIVAHIPAPPLTIRVDQNIRQNLPLTLDEVCRHANLTYESLVGQLRGACVAMSGVFADEDRFLLRQILQELRLAGDFPLVLCEDANAHLAANFISVGGVIIGGTGSNVCFRGLGMDRPVRVDGWGSGIGDEGGGYDLGLQTLKVILKGIDGRLDRSETLERAVLEYIGLAEPRLSRSRQQIGDDIVNWYYSVRNRADWRMRIADLAVPLVREAEHGSSNNTLARQLVEMGANAIAQSLLAIIPRIRNDIASFRNPIPVVLEGGLFQHSRTYVKTIIAAGKSIQTQHGLQLEFMAPSYVPVVGAVALASIGADYIEADTQFFSLLRQSAEHSLTIGRHILNDVR